MKTKELVWSHDNPGTVLDTAHRRSVQSSVQHKHTLVLNTSTQLEINSLRLHSAADRKTLVRFSRSIQDVSLRQTSRPALGSSQTSCWMRTGKTFSGVKRPVCDTGNLPPPSAEVWT